MDGIKHKPGTALEDAIATIDRFLADTEHDRFDMDGTVLQRLSAVLSRAKSARTHSPVHDHAFEAARRRYSACLESLKERLAQLEIHLQRERDTLLEQQAHLSRTRDWHDLVRRMQ